MVKCANAFLFVAATLHYRVCSGVWLYINPSLYQINFLISNWQPRFQCHMNKVNYYGDNLHNHLSNAHSFISTDETQSNVETTNGEWYIY